MSEARRYRVTGWCDAVGNTGECSLFVTAYSAEDAWFQAKLHAARSQHGTPLRPTVSWWALEPAPLPENPKPAASARHEEPVPE